ncbi:MAG: hypothetical protein OHK0046_08240 [Anaerolineae bacterium]
MFCEPETVGDIKTDLMAAWITAEWLPEHPEARVFWVPEECTNAYVLSRYDKAFPLPNGYQFDHMRAIPCSAVPALNTYNWQGYIATQLGAFVFTFTQGETQREVLVLNANYREESYYIVALGAMEADFVKTWMHFANECVRLAYAQEPSDRVVIIGGSRGSFVPTVDWSEVVLPEALKQDIQNDVEAFFTKGVSVYTRLNLKPFRKFLLAGVPGTGKTMICSALAKWALSKGYLVIYVSSARHRQGEDHASSFNKIDEALSIGASSDVPTLIIVEELDAYLHTDEKALVLNVLDGSEADINPHGTLLVSTTNYPEAIDERVLKRPGRLDRIFIIPETKHELDVEKMLRQYLGVVWDDAHTALIPLLVGYPGAFIREVAVYALTQMAYDDLETLSVDLLMRSFARLKDQIEARDEFLLTRVTVQNGSHAE